MPCCPVPNAVPIQSHRCRRTHPSHQGRSTLSGRDCAKTVPGLRPVEGVKKLSDDPCGSAACCSMKGLSRANSTLVPPASINSLAASPDWFSALNSISGRLGFPRIDSTVNTWRARRITNSHCIVEFLGSFESRYLLCQCQPWFYLRLVGLQLFLVIRGGIWCGLVLSSARRAREPAGV